MNDDTKYKRRFCFYDEAGRQQSEMHDVYDVLVAFGVTCPARAHAIKKLLAAGQRGKGSELDDLRGAALAVERAIQLAECQSPGEPDATR